MDNCAIADIEDDQVVPDAEAVGRARLCPVTITPYLEEDWSLYDNDNDNLTTDEDDDSSSESEERAVAFFLQDGDAMSDMNLFQGEDDDLAQVLHEGGMDEDGDEGVAAGIGNMEGDEGNGECKALLEKAEKVGAQLQGV